MVIATMYCLWCASQIYLVNPRRPPVGEEADLGVLVFLVIYFFLPHCMCIMSMNPLDTSDHLPLQFHACFKEYVLRSIKITKRNLVVLFTHLEICTFCNMRAIYVAVLLTRAVVAKKIFVHSMCKRHTFLLDLIGFLYCIPMFCSLELGHVSIKKFVFYLDQTVSVFEYMYLLGVVCN